MTALLAIGAAVVVLIALTWLILLVAVIGLLHNTTAALTRHRATLVQVGMSVVALEAQVTRLATVLNGPIRLEWPASTATPPIDRIPTAGGTH